MDTVLPTTGGTKANLALVCQANVVVLGALGWGEGRRQSGLAEMSSTVTDPVSVGMVFAHLSQKQIPPGSPWSQPKPSDDGIASDQSCSISSFQLLLWDRFKGV